MCAAAAVAKETRTDAAIVFVFLVFFLPWDGDTAKATQ